MDITPTPANQNTHNQIMSSTSDHMKALVVNAMDEFCQISKPTSFQTDAIVCLLLMDLNKIDCKPTLLIQPTGSGKSLIPIIFGMITKGIVLIIESTISLSSDQASKIDNMKQKQGHRVTSFQLDTIQESSHVQKMNEYLLNLQEKIYDAVFIYSSPEMLVSKRWKKLINPLLTKRLIRFICIDEIHQFIRFGTTFWPSFQD